MELENCYGMRKRIAFLEEVVRRLKPRTVLDIGCGTGAQVTFPLAMTFPEITFIGADSDAASLKHAEHHHTRANLSFVSIKEIGDLQGLDLIIASEVVEHVPDPEVFLSWLRGKLAANGSLVVTVPNGYGPFEFLSLTQCVLYLTGAETLIRDAKRVLLGRRAAASVPSDTLAVSPHINFFSYRSLMRLLATQGFRLEEYRGRTFLCGFGVDQVMRHPRLLRWNADIADSLPPSLVSGWMFLLRPQAAIKGPGYRRGWYGQFRRWLNEYRFGVKVV